MSNLFVVFILFLSGILCFKVDYLIVSVLFSIFCLFHIIKKKLSKKYLIVCLLFVLFGLFRIKIHTAIPSISEDKMDFFRKYRDVYGDKYGKDNVIIEMVWENESFNGSGKRIFKLK